MGYEEANKVAMQRINNYAQSVNTMSVPEPTFKRLCEIADAVATLGRDGFLFEDINDTMVCPFCDASYYVGDIPNVNRDHKPDCIYLKARLLIEHKEGVTQE